MSKTESKGILPKDAVRFFGLAEEERSAVRRQRTVLLTDQDMDGCTSSEFIKDFFILVAEKTKKPISVIISSEGGSLWSCLAIIRAIRYAQSRDIKVNGHVFGNAFSAAFLVLQACNHRTMGSESILMMHGISHFPFGDSKNIKKDQSMIDSVSSMFCGMLADRNTSENSQYKDSEYLMTLLEESTPNYFDAQLALESGWIDEIDE